MPVPSDSCPRLAALVVLMAATVAQAACRPAPDPRRTQFQVERDGVSAAYDPTTGRLQRLTLDTNRDGRADTWSWMHGARVERIAIDRDGDGAADRWEYFDAAGALLKIGASSVGDGVPDTWMYQGADGLVARIARATTRRDTVDRVEHYERNQLTRIVTDTDLDGQWDTWEQFEAPASPGDAPVLRMIEFDLEHAGRPTHRLLYRADGSFDRSESLTSVAAASPPTAPAAGAAGRTTSQTP